MRRQSLSPTGVARADDSGGVRGGAVARDWRRDCAFSESISAYRAYRRWQVSTRMDRELRRALAWAWGRMCGWLGDRSGSWPWRFGGRVREWGTASFWGCVKGRVEDMVRVVQKLGEGRRVIVMDGEVGVEGVKEKWVGVSCVKWPQMVNDFASLLPDVVVVRSFLARFSWPSDWPSDGDNGWQFGDDNCGSDVNPSRSGRDVEMSGASVEGGAWTRVVVREFSWGVWWGEEGGSTVASVVTNRWCGESYVAAVADV